MKKLILAAAMTLSSASAFANYCEAHLVDRYGSVRRVFPSYDSQNGCKEAMKECSKTIRMDSRYSVNTHDCVRANDNYPNPNPNPGPQNPYPYPDTNPYPGQDVRRALNTNEKVYYNSRLATITGIGYNYNTYAIRTTDMWNNTVILSNINRDALAVTTGCNNSLCANDSVISLNSQSSGKNARIVGLSTDNRFVIETTDMWNNRIIQSSVDRSLLAETKGCTYNYATICVGERVIDSRTNRDGTVIGIQSNGYVVLRTTDMWNNTIIQTSVNPSSLYRTR